MSDPNASLSQRKIILFDGVCDLCNGFVQFVIDRDPQARFMFGTLQSPAAQELLRGQSLNPMDLETVIYIRGEKIYTRSGAALRILGDIGGGWSLARLKLGVPPPLRDAVYRFIARRRYRWFGKRETCMVPTPELRARFLQEPVLKNAK
jgi:predicted DCC family thiol-disulfide oxidoreductase YuxK